MMQSSLYDGRSTCCWRPSYHSYHDRSTHRTSNVVQPLSYQNP